MTPPPVESSRSRSLPESVRDVLEQMVNVLASVLVVASVVIASALVLLVARESVVPSGRFLRLCIVRTSLGSLRA